MPDSLPTYANLPIVLQWAAGVLTVLVGVMLMIWAAKRWLPPVSDRLEDQKIGQPLSVFSTQLINDPQFLQLIISGQALILKELQSLNNLARERNLLGDRASDQLESHTRQFDEMCRHLEQLTRKR